MSSRQKADLQTIHLAGGGGITISWCSGQADPLHSDRPKIILLASEQEEITESSVYYSLMSEFSPECATLGWDILQLTAGAPTKMATERNVHAFTQQFDWARQASWFTFDTQSHSITDQAVWEICLSWEKDKTKGAHVYDEQPVYGSAALIKRFRVGFETAFHCRPRILHWRGGHRYPGMQSGNVELVVRAVTDASIHADLITAYLDTQIHGWQAGFFLIHVVPVSADGQNTRQTMRQSIRRHIDGRAGHEPSQL